MKQTVAMLGLSILISMDYENLEQCDDLDVVIDHLHSFADKFVSSDTFWWKKTVDVMLGISILTCIDYKNLEHCDTFDVVVDDMHSSDSDLGLFNSDPFW